MNKIARIFRMSVTAMIAAGPIGGLAFHYNEVLAQEPGSKTPIQAPDPWIGKKVVTKYSVPVRGISAESGPDRIFRDYTVKERKGDQLRLEYRGANGWIKATEVLLLDSAADFYSQEVRLKPTSAAGYHQRGLIWTFKGENDKAIADYNEVIRMNPTDAQAHANRGFACASK